MFPNLDLKCEENVPRYGGSGTEVELLKLKKIDQFPDEPFEE